MIRQAKRNRTRSSGFTLYEIMAVITIMSILASLTVSSIKSLGSANQLNQAVQLISRSTVVARQLAMGSGQPVALVVSNTSNPVQALTILKGTPNSTGTAQWEVAKPWETIPTGVGTQVFQRDGQETFYSQSSIGTGLSGNLPAKLNGDLVSNYYYIVFRPDGTVAAPQIGPSLSLKRLNKDNTDNDYIILVQETTGRSRVIEP